MFFLQIWAGLGCSKSFFIVSGRKVSRFLIDPVRPPCRFKSFPGRKCVKSVQRRRVINRSESNALFTRLFHAGLSHLVSHLVRLHHWSQAVTRSTFQHIDTDLAVVGSRGLEVHKEIHLLIPQLFKMDLERINSGDVNCCLW